MASDQKSIAQIGRRAELLDGAPIADQIKREVASEISQHWPTPETRPCLAAIIVGDDPASAVYVKNKIRACSEVGIRSEHIALPESTTAAELRELIISLNSRNEIGRDSQLSPTTASCINSGGLGYTDLSRNDPRIHTNTRNKTAIFVCRGISRIVSF